VLFLLCSTKQSSTVRFNPEASGSKLQAVEVTGGFYAVCMETNENKLSIPTRKNK
jgi:hypothetical protein